MVSKTEKFLKQVREIHGDRYDYSDTVYTRLYDKVKIICVEHGPFLQVAKTHRCGSGCPKCGRESSIKSKTLNTEDFIKKSKMVHSDFYDYNSSIYTHSKEKIEICCPKHGLFRQTASNHMAGSGCPKCNGSGWSTTKLTKESFINKSTIIHNNRYDYINTNYTGGGHDVEIICKIHGKFYQKPHRHLMGRGCSKCGRDLVASKLRSNTEEFIYKSKLIHGDLYDYQNVIYSCNSNNVDIICKEHGTFQQSPNRHLNGRGCPICQTSYPVKCITKYLEDNNIEFETEKKFKSCKNKRPLPFDFYLPKQNLLIEYDGEFHYQPIFGEDHLKYAQNNDNIKTQWCIDNDHKLLRIPYWELENLESILKESLC